MSFLASLFGGGGGQQQQQPSSSTVYQSTLPEYAKPYVENLFGRARDISGEAYTPYTGQRQADLAPQTQQAIQGISQNVGIANPYIQQAGQAFGNAANNFSAVSQYNAPSINSGYTANNIQSSYRPGDTSSQYKAGEITSTYSPNVAQSTYNPNAIQSTYQAAGYTPTDAIMREAPTWTQAQAQQYMSPYMQSVTDVQKREAARQSAIGGVAEQAQATQAGGYGGYRHGIVEAERARNLGMLQNQIEAQGLQQAYTQGAQQFNADRASQLAAAQAAQNASQFQYGATQQAQQTQGAQNLQAQLASEQARQQAGAQGLQAYGLTAQAQQAAGAQGLQAQIAGQQAQQAQGAQYLQGRQLSEQAGQAAGTQNLQAQMASEQALQNQGAQSLQAQQAQAEANRAAAQLWLGAGQADLGLGQGLGSLGTTAQKAAAFDNSQLLSAGNIEQQYQQAGLNQRYQDFLAQTYWPSQQLQEYSSILRGNVVQPSTLQATYQQPADPVSQALALGIGGAGLAKAFG